MLYKCVTRGKTEKLDILIDDDGVKDDEEPMEESKEVVGMPGYDLLSEREKKVTKLSCLSYHTTYNL